MNSTSRTRLFVQLDFYNISEGATFVDVATKLSKPSEHSWHLNGPLSLFIDDCADMTYTYLRYWWEFRQLLRLPAGRPHVLPAWLVLFQLQGHGRALQCSFFYVQWSHLRLWRPTWPL